MKYSATNLETRFFLLDSIGLFNGVKNSNFKSSACDLTLEQILALWLFVNHKQTIKFTESEAKTSSPDRVLLC